MKKIIIIIVAMVILAVTGVFLIHEHSRSTDVTRNKTKIGVILNGTIDDKTWSQSHYEGMQKAAESLNLQVIYEECVPENEECVPYMEKMINDGCKIIICNSFDYGEWELQVANENPNIYFFHATGTKTGHNMSTYFGRIYQIRYLSGIVAGMQTKTNEIGYIAAFPISEVIRGANAFALGVRSVNPDAKVHIIYTNSWFDDDMTRKATNKLLIDYKDIDVLSMHSDSLAPLQIAEERGIWSIGYNLDNYKLFPNTYLTAPVWNWEAFYTDKILACLQGKFKQETYWEGIESGIMDLAPFSPNVNIYTQTKVEKAKKEFMNGTFDVFYGPIYDNNGKLRIEEGENMSDYAMLNSFDWYVEGVDVDEQ